MVRIPNPWRLKGEVTVARPENLRGWKMGNQSECWWNNTILLLGQDLWSGKTFQVWIGRIHLTHGSLKPLRPLCLPHKGQAGPLQVGHLQWQQGIEPHVANHLWHFCCQVAESANPPKELGYLYLYKRVWNQRDWAFLLGTASAVRLKLKSRKLVFAGGEGGALLYLWRKTQWL